MRFFKFLFTLSSAVASFVGVIYLFQRYQDYMSEGEHFPRQPKEFDSDDSASESVSSNRSDLSEVYYKTMDPEEISESN